MATQSITSVGAGQYDGLAVGGSSVQRQEIAVDVAEVASDNEVELSSGALENVVSQINAYVQNTQRDMDFSVDDSTGEVVVKVVDSVNDKVIRQIPSEDMLALSRHVLENMETEQTKGFLIELEA